ncbi:unnamed protein product [Microthlaspi erraticum]|uniref:Uncharacterized protein n=1 Tax=Microthlaspi erraticum TaxID=1685480 RepID=A0A6D2JS19_9BRAS|nr:unnamed protein product [Microthlaspi erraticum]
MSIWWAIHSWIDNLSMNVPCTIALGKSCRVLVTFSLNPSRFSSISSFGKRRFMLRPDRGFLTFLLGLKTYRESFGHMDHRRKQAETERKELDRVTGRSTRATKARSTCSEQLDRMRKETARSIPCEESIDPMQTSSSIDPVLSQPFDQSRSDDITAVRSTWCKPTRSNHSEPD